MSMASIKVAVRVRPLNKREDGHKSSAIIQMSGNTTYITNVKLPHAAPPSDNIGGPLGRQRIKQFTYDYSYWSAVEGDPEYASQEKVFQDLGRGVVTSAYEGYNACVFAYGQTGSGKTYTMMGNEGDVGLTPRICENLFENMKEGDTQYRCEVSYMEIYNERVRDLLRESGGIYDKVNLRVREHPKDGPYVHDLSKHIVVNYSDIEELIKKGNNNRTTAATNMNDESSRSHAIFTIVFTQASFHDDIPCEIHSKIHLVDLAGSERVDASGATGQRLKEGGSINKSLVTLGNVISTLADISDRFSIARKHVFIPYRDSILTWLLKDSLGGNARTIMIATVSPADCNYAETLSTLRYANRAKRIINKPMINEDPNVKLIRELREENANLKAILGQNMSTITTMNTSDTQEKLSKNEQKVKHLTEKWTDKFKETAIVLQEHKTLALRQTGSGVVLDSDLPYLLALDEDPLSTGMTLYHLKEGETKVGREDAENQQDIEPCSKVKGTSDGLKVLTGYYVEDEHCVFSNCDGEVRIMPIENAPCTVNNNRIHHPVLINHGAIIRLGRNNVFRFNHPIEAAKMREQIKLNGSSELLKLSPDIQWTWSSHSINDSGVSSDVRSTPNSVNTTVSLESEQKYSEEYDKLEAKRREIEALEQSHIFSEASRLSQIVEQEGDKEELLEQQELLEELATEVKLRHKKTTKAEKEIKRLSANAEYHIIEHQEMLQQEEEAIEKQKQKLERDLAKARQERQQLRKEREKARAKLLQERERQQQEWEQLNEEKRLAEEEKQNFQINIEKEREKVAREKKIEKQVYSEAVTDMRTMIEKELKEMQRLVGISVGDLSVGDSSTADTEAEKQDGQKSVVSTRGSTRGSTRASMESDIGSYASSSRMPENSLPLTSHSNNNKMIDSLNADTVSLQSSIDEDFVIDNDLILKMEDLISSPVLPSRYFEGSPIVEKPTNVPLNMDDSFISTLSELSVEDMSCSTAYTESSEQSDSQDHTMYLLDQLALQVTAIHERVCAVLTRKYNSVMSADDKTHGLDQEVIARFTDVKPLFEQLEKISLQASQQQLTTELVNKLDLYDRMLTMVDQLLRVHNALQVIALAVKTHRYQEAVLNLKAVQIVVNSIEPEHEREFNVVRALKSELCLQRETLLYNIGEKWNGTLKWTLPSEHRRNTKQTTTTSLEVNDSSDSDTKLDMQSSAQAMHDMNLLSNRLQLLSTRVMQHFVQAIVRDRNTLMQVVTEANRSILSVVQYPLTEKPTTEGATASSHVTFVPPAEMFQKLEQVFMFLHKPLSSIHINQALPGQPELQHKVPLVKEFGEQISKGLFDCIFNDCLSHMIPSSNSDWDQFNEVVRLTERFQESLLSMNFVASGSSTLMDYFNNVNTIFANAKSQTMLKQAHEFMTHDLLNSVQICTEFPLGRDVRHRSHRGNGILSDQLLAFISKCREESSSSMKIPTCQISICVRCLVCLAYETLREGVSSSIECTIHLSHSVFNLFELYCDVVPSYHKDRLTNMPMLADITQVLERRNGFRIKFNELDAPLHHNNCMFVAHHLVALDKQFQQRLQKSKVDAMVFRRLAQLGDMVPRIRKIGNDNFTQHIVIKKQHLCDYLMMADGFECIADDNGKIATQAVNQMLKHLRHIATIWFDVLPAKVYCKAIGALLNSAVTDIMDSILHIGEFSADDCDCLQQVLSCVTLAAPDFFHVEISKSSPEVLLHEHVQLWMRFTELHHTLRSGLQTLSDRWAAGKGPLALHFTPEEVQRLVVAMFENTSKRDAVLAQIC